MGLCHKKFYIFVSHFGRFKMNMGEYSEEQGELFSLRYAKLLTQTLKDLVKTWSETIFGGYKRKYLKSSQIFLFVYYKFKSNIE